MKPSLSIIKIGGNVIDNPEMLQEVLKKFAALPSAKILIHGGGKIATATAKKLGVKTTMVEGRRITDEPMLEVVTMVYGGLVNKNIVAKLQSMGNNAIGLTGADANIIPAHKREVREIDYGFVGDINIDEIKADKIAYLLNGDLTPVVCALTHDSQGNLLNTNADTMASSIAMALANDFDIRLIYCFEKPGVLLDADDDGTLVRELDNLHYQRLKDDGIIFEGMIPKLDNAFLAKRHGVSVEIKHANNLNNDIGTILQ